MNYSHLPLVFLFAFLTSVMLTMMFCNFTNKMNIQLTNKNKRDLLWLTFSSLIFVAEFAFLAQLLLTP